jgi:flagellar motor switch protein FliN/FliY
MSDSIDPRLAAVADSFGAAAAAAAAALGLPDVPVASEPAGAVLDALGAPASLAAALRIGGAVSGDLVLLSVADLDPILDDSSMGGLTPLSNRVRALRAAADSLGVRYGDAVEADPTELSGDLVCTLSVAGVAVAALALRLPAPVVEETVVDEPEAAAPAEAMREPVAVGAGAPSVEAGFRSTVPGIPVGEGHGPVATRLDQLTHVPMEVTVEIGRTRMSVGELLGLAPGQVVELDRPAGAPVDLFVNGTLLARGEVVVVDEDFGFRVTEIVAGQG